MGAAGARAGKALFAGNEIDGRTDGDGLALHGSHAVRHMSSDSFQEPLAFEEIRQKTEQYVLDTYRRAPVAFFFGQGEYLYDTEQKRYLDFLSGIAVTNLGHGEADIVEAIRSQAERLMHTSNLFYNEEQARLAEVLVEHSFPGKVFFCNSGTEANEAAFKLARRYGQEMRNGAFRLLALDHSFHGRTAGAMSLTGQKKVRTGFGPMVPGVDFVPANDMEGLERAVSSEEGDACALFVELVQGEGGVHVLDKAYVKEARKFCEENEILFIVDEVQTGMGRTGRLFAYEHYDIEPDAITLAKGLGAGFPIGAVIIADKYAPLLKPGMHGSTFGGNHLACRVAFETLRLVVGRELLAHAEAVSEYLFRRLRALQKSVSAIVDVRGLGLLIGIELDRPGADLVDECRDRGLLINCTSENVLRLLPPLTISLESAAEALDILEKEIRRRTA